MMDVWVTFDHAHSIPGFSSRPGFCHRGLRDAARKYGLDWDRIVKDGGIWASELEATGDAMAMELAAWARGMKDGQR